MRAAWVLAIVTVLGSLSAPALAESRSEPRPVVYLLTRPFRLDDGYSVRVVAARVVHRRTVHIEVSLRRTVRPAVGEQATSEQDIDVTLHQSTLHARPRLQAGRLETGDELGALGTIAIGARRAGPLRTSESCDGPVPMRVEHRPVAFTGTISLNPDDGSSFFGTVQSPAGLMGTLVRMWPDSRSTACRHHHPTGSGSGCETGRSLQFYDPASGLFFLAAAFTDPRSGAPEDFFTASVGAAMGPHAFRSMTLFVTAPDASWLTLRHSVETGRLDADGLGLTAWLSGSADYARDKAVGVDRQPMICGGRRFRSSFSDGNLGAPVSITFDGVGTFRSAVDSNDEATAEYDAPAGSASLAATSSATVVPHPGLGSVLRAFDTRSRIPTR